MQLKSFDLQEESIESELRNWNYGQKNFKFKSAWNQIFKFVKTLFKLIKQKEGLEKNTLALVSLYLDKRLRNGEGLKIRG